MLLRLHEVPPTIGELADYAHVSRSSARAAVMALVRQGLAEAAGSALSGGTTYRALQPSEGRRESG